MCNALIQPHFGYACAAWYPNLNKKYKKKLQILQNQCIRSTYNWITESTSELNNLTRLTDFQCPQYMNEIYTTNNQNNTVTRNSSLKLF